MQKYTQVLNSQFFKMVLLKILKIYFHDYNIDGNVNKNLYYNARMITEC